MKRVWFALIGLTVIIPASPEAADVVIYDNTTGTGFGFYSAQNGAETIDDLRVVGSGRLTSLAFEYVETATGGSLTATVTLYDESFLEIGSPYEFTDLPSGQNLFSVDIVDGPDLPEGVVRMGIRFSTTTAGLVIKDPPSVGSSEDSYSEGGQFLWFDGDPPANFSLRLQADVETPVLPETWGGLKARY